MCECIVSVCVCVCVCVSVCVLCVSVAESESYLSGSCAVWMIRPLSAACQDDASLVRYPCECIVSVCV